MKKAGKIILSAMLLTAISMTALPFTGYVEGVAAVSPTLIKSGTLSNGIRWSVDTAAYTLTFTGKGKVDYGDSRDTIMMHQGKVNTVIFSDGITGYEYLPLDADMCVLGKDVESISQVSTPRANYEVSSQNKNFSAYNGILYSADHKTLISVPNALTEVSLSPDVKVIGDLAFYNSMVDAVVLPKGVTEFSETAFTQMLRDSAVAIVVPDSCTKMGLKKAPSSAENVAFLYSNNNTAAKAAFPQNTREDSLFLLERAWKKFGYRSVEEIYSGATSTTYGWRKLCNNLFFVTKQGLAEDGWIYDQGEYYYYNRVLMQKNASVTEHLNYKTEDGKTRVDSFTFADSGILTTSPPRGMLATTTESLAPTKITEYKKKGLQYIDGKAYIFDDNGVMKKSGWYTADGFSFYLNDYGAGVVNCWRLGTDGKYRYLLEDGKMAVNAWITDYGKTYYVGPDGKKFTGTHVLSRVSCEFDSNGVLLSQKKVDNGWSIQSDGSTYFFKSDGGIAADEFVVVDGATYYLNDSGHLVTGQWMQTKGNWYWLGGSGKVAQNQWLKLADGKWYYFFGNGAMASNKWQKSGGKWYYLQKSGAMATNTWVKSGSDWYYLDGNGVMMTNRVTPDGRRVDAQGRRR